MHSHVNPAQISPEILRKRLTLIALAVVLSAILINLLSAYIRHQEAGLSCSNWPECYAVIGGQVDVTSSQEVAQRALSPTVVAKKTHRVAATLLVILILYLVQQSRQAAHLVGVNSLLPNVLAGLLLLLAVVGPASYLKTMPAIAFANYMAGALLMAVAWWYWLQLRETREILLPPTLKRLLRFTLGLLLAQLALGIWVSGNFAALACPQLLSCEALPAGGDLSFWYLRELQLDAGGKVIQFNSAALMNGLHRIMAVVLALSLLAVVVRVFARRDVFKQLAFYLLGLLFLQLIIGATAVVFSLPLFLVLAHNAVAALLLLLLIKLNYIAV